MIKEWLIIFLSIFVFSGCNLLPKINFNTENTVPQEVDKGKRKIKCKGDLVLNKNGTIAKCSKGFYFYEEIYEKKERRFTFKEKIINFFRNLTGYSFWIFIALIFLCPSFLGYILGRLIEGTFGIAKKALNSTVRGIQKTRKEGKTLDDSLASEQDYKIKNYIRKLKMKSKIK